MTATNTFQNAMSDLVTAFRTGGADSAPTWDTVEHSERRFCHAHASLVSYITTRAYTVLAQEAYRQTRGESTRGWVNVFAYHYPRKTVEMATAPPNHNMWWANFATVALIEGPREDPTLPARLGLTAVEAAVRAAIEYEGSPFRLFVYYAGKRHGTVFQVRWDKSVSSKYIDYCAFRKLTSDVRPGEAVVGTANNACPP